MHRPSPWPLVTLPLALASVLLHLSPALEGSLQYERAGIAAGEVFRVLTCHWTHWSSSHLLWDATTFAVLGGVCERRGRLPVVGCIVLSALLIPLGIWTLIPGMETYRGLSGIDSALFVLLAAGLLRESLASGERLWTLVTSILLLAFASKVGWELASGRTVFADVGADAMVPVPLAHIIGGAVGLGVAWIPGRRGTPAAGTT